MLRVVRLAVPRVVLRPPGVHVCRRGCSVRTALRLIPRSEVARHSRDGDAWIVVRGRVYDVSAYAEQHPGGMVIVEHAGGDASALFDGACSCVPRTLANACIGVQR